MPRYILYTTLRMSISIYCTHHMYRPKKTSSIMFLRFTVDIEPPSCTPPVVFVIRNLYTNPELCKDLLDPIQSYPRSHPDLLQTPSRAVSVICYRVPRTALTGFPESDVAPMVQSWPPMEQWQISHLSCLFHWPTWLWQRLNIDPEV
jgi:hypothetical protein